MAETYFQKTAGTAAEGESMTERGKIFVSANGRRGCCPKCGQYGALADVEFPGEKIVNTINCPGCVLGNGLIQGWIMASVGFSFWAPMLPTNYDFVRK